MEFDSSIAQIRNFVEGARAARQVDATSPKGAAAIPTQSGRSSQPQNSSLFGILVDEMAQINPGFELELLKVCQHLATYNGDVSYAVDNVCQLGNTPYKVVFDSSTPDDRKKKMLAVISEQGQWVYPGGMRMLIGDILAQIYVTGAASGEIIPDKTLKFVQNVALVNPISVRFLYNPSNYSYDPYQATNGFAGSEIRKMSASNDFGLIKLNPLTYKYIAHRRYNDNPFAIPPILASFEGIEIEKDMLNNMRHIVRKMGVFGFLSVMVTAPVREQGEKPNAYFDRCNAYLSKIKPEIEKGYASGVALGFKGFQEWKVEGGNTNLAGAKEIFQLVSEIKMAGLKQDPLMLGRNFNVAETMAKVIMSKLIMQTGNFQAVAGLFIAEVIKMMLGLNGYMEKNIKVEFEPPMIGDRLRDAQAREKEIDNSLKERDAGLIGQQEAANNLKHDRPYAPKDVDYSVARVSETAKAAKPTDGKPKPVKDAVDSGATNYSMGYLRDQLTKGYPEYNYGSCDCTDMESFAKEPGNKKYLSVLNQYTNDVVVTYYGALDKVTLKIKDKLASLSPNATLTEVTDLVFYTLYSEFTNAYASTQEQNIKKWVKNSYESFREDREVFGGNDTVTDKTGKTVPVPAAVFSMDDIKAMDYFKESDLVYLTRFITDSDTIKTLNNYIKGAYLAKLGIAGDVNSTEFISGLLAVLSAEDWKLRRVVETSVNKMRNFAYVTSLAEVGVSFFQVVGVNDSKQCKHCNSIQGYKFSVTSAYDKVKKAYGGTPDTIEQDSPFITSLFTGDTGIRLLQQLTGEELQAQGLIGVPPFHANCRDKIVMI